jgi:hypothetical protein
VGAGNRNKLRNTEIIIRLYLGEFKKKIKKNVLNSR